MDNLITQLEELTEELMSQIQYVDSDALESFVEQRDEIITALQQESQKPSEEQKSRVMKILSYDQVLATRMEQLRLEASQSIAKMDAAKVQRNKYEMNYEPESVFFDMRK